MRIIIARAALPGPCGKAAATGTTRARLGVPVCMISDRIQPKPGLKPCQKPPDLATMSFSSMLGSYKTAAKPQKRAADDGDDRHAKRPAVGAADASAAAPPAAAARRRMARQGDVLPDLAHFSSQIRARGHLVLDHLTRDGCSTPGTTSPHEARRRDVESVAGHAPAAALNGARAGASRASRPRRRRVRTTTGVAVRRVVDGGAIAAGYHAVIFATPTRSSSPTLPRPSLHARATRAALAATSAARRSRRATATARAAAMNAAAARRARRARVSSATYWGGAGAQVHHV